MKKFVSQVCNPLEAGSLMTSTVKSMEEDMFYLTDWSALSYWSVEQKHDLVLILMEFDNDRD